MSVRQHLCVALAFLNLHRPDCEHCGAQNCMGIAMRRLRELNEHAERMSRQESQGAAQSSEDDAA